MARYFQSCVVHKKSFILLWGKNLLDLDFKEVLLFEINELESTPRGEKLSTSSKHSSVDLDRSLVKQNKKQRISFTFDGEGEKVRLKCIYGSEIRVITVNSSISYKDLQQRLSHEYNETPLVMQYKDEENDSITIRSQSDLEEAFQFLFETGGQGGYLRIDLSPAVNRSLPSSFGSSPSRRSGSSLYPCNNYNY